jgi:ATP-dependent Clp protease ATP-binding subunit ClpC
MNDEILTKLMVLVERAVRPVRASVSRKREMREELLAHVTTIFDEEVEKSGDGRIALERSTQRFGDPREISHELRSSVPRWNRIQGFQQGGRFEPGETSLHFAAKYSVGTVIIYAIAIVGTFAITLLTGRWRDFTTTLHVMPVITAVSAVFVFLLLLFGSKISRALYGSDSERSVRTVISCCLASVLLFPTLATLIYWGSWLGVPNSTLLLACAIAPATPVLVVLMARQMADEVRPDEEWARLDIDT